MFVLIIGSAPDALEAQSFNRELFQQVVAINNAWNVRSDWDYCIFPDDFPENRRPNENNEQRLIGSSNMCLCKINMEDSFTLEALWLLLPDTGF